MSKGRIAGLVLLGLLAYLLFLLTTLPAAQVWRFAAPRLPVQAYGLSGTVWEGRAAAVQQDNRRLDDVRWALAPVNLLIGRLRVDVQAQPPGGRLRSELTLAPGGLVDARDLRLEMPIADFVQWIGVGQLPVRLEGQLDVLMQQLVMQGRNLATADGLVSWHNAIVRFGSAPLPFGNVALRLQPAAGGVNGTLTSQGAPIDIGGTLRIGEDGRFVLDLAVRTTGEIGDDTRTALNLLGIPADGSQLKARLTGALDGSGLQLRKFDQ